MRKAKVDRLVRKAVAGRRLDGRRSLRGRWAVRRLVRAAPPPGPISTRLVGWLGWEWPGYIGTGFRDRLRGVPGDLRFASPWQRARRRAVDGVGRAWLADPASDELWEALSRSWSAHELRQWVMRAMAHPDRGPGSRAAIGAACLGRGFLPADDRDRAAFLVLTGQAEQHRAMDPDGSRLAAAYGAAGDRTRAALRAAMVDAGVDLASLVTVVGGGHAAGEDRRALSASEAEYLTRRLAEQRDWPRLWRLLPAMPLRQAVVAALEIDDWAPTAARDRALYEAFAAVLDHTWATAHLELSHAARRTVPLDEVCDGSAEVRALRGCFSPDGSRLVVQAYTPEVGVGRGCVLATFDTAQGRLIDRRTHTSPSDLTLTLDDMRPWAADDGVIYLVDTHGPGDLQESYQLMWTSFDGGRSRTLGVPFSRNPLRRPVCLGDRLMASDTERQSIRRIGLDGDRDEVPFAALALEGLGTCRFLGTSAAGERVGLGWEASWPHHVRLGTTAPDHEIVVCDPDLQALARTSLSWHAGPLRSGGFDGPDRLVTVGGVGGTVRLAAWQVADDQLVRVVERPLRHELVAEPIVLPLQRRIIWSLQRRGDFAVIDADTLEPVVAEGFDAREVLGLLDIVDQSGRSRPLGPDGQPCRMGGTELWQSADGNVVGSWTRGILGSPVIVADASLHHVRDRLAMQPPNALRMEDAAVLLRAGAQLTAMDAPAAAALVGLLGAWLEHRFGAAIALGGPRAPGAGPTDVALGDR